MGQARFVECGEILQRDFGKGFSMQRFVPVFPVNGERLVVMPLEKQGITVTLEAAVSMSRRSSGVSSTETARCFPASDVASWCLGSEQSTASGQPSEARSGQVSVSLFL